MRSISPLGLLLRIHSHGWIDLDWYFHAGEGKGYFNLNVFAVILKVLLRLVELRKR
jgi:hypothetical protein